MEERVGEEKDALACWMTCREYQDEKRKIEAALEKEYGEMATASAPDATASLTVSG